MCRPPWTALAPCTDVQYPVRMFSEASPSSDLTAKATIRNKALRLFADRGPDAVTVRDVAAAAEVSPALVMHHFGSKAGLREAVDEHVAQTFDAMLDTLTDAEVDDALARRRRDVAGRGVRRRLPAGLAAAGLPASATADQRPDGRSGVRPLVGRERTGAGGVGRGGHRTTEPGPAGAGRLPSGQRPRAAAARTTARARPAVRRPDTAGMAAWAAEAVDVYAKGAFRASGKGET